MTKLIYIKSSDALERGYVFIVTVLEKVNKDSRWILF